MDYYPGQWALRKSYNPLINSGWEEIPRGRSRGVLLLLKCQPTYDLGYHCLDSPNSLIVFLEFVNQYNLTSAC